VKKSTDTIWWPAAPDHVFAHARLADVDPEFPQFTMDLRSAPERIVVLKYKRGFINAVTHWRQIKPALDGSLRNLEPELFPWVREKPKPKAKPNQNPLTSGWHVA
jgi:hypothetical protein